MQTVKERFLRYIQIDTQSKDGLETVPSTAKQHDLATMLTEELTVMGASNVRYDKEHCYVYAEIPATTNKDVPSMGFIAHMDTVEGVSGDVANVHPQVIPCYDGKNIVLNKEHNIVMATEEFPELAAFTGKELITTDGTTVLGADDKAGVAEIMVLAETLLAHPEIPHGKICVGFTPDEEVGNGVKFFDVEHFGADIGYTVDGGALGELEYENFNAASAFFTFHGKSFHTGGAKGRMINAAMLAMELDSLLPEQKRPQYTEGYEGFYHLMSLKGEVETAQSAYLIREHDAALFQQMKDYLHDAAAFLNKKYGRDCVELVIRDSYRNMREIILEHFDLIERAKEKMLALGMVPDVHPIRGGTDGATLSYRGLPCPNLCTGGHNAHGRYEFVCTQDMEKITELLLALATID